MSPTPTFGTQLIGQTEKALGAILHRLLDGTNMTEPQWVTLSIAVASGGTADLDGLTRRVASVLKVSDEQARGRISELAAAQLLEVRDNDEAPVKLTDAGQTLFAQTRAAVTEITERLWGDLPAEDLVVAGRVLSTVLARTNQHLAAAASRTQAHNLENVPKKSRRSGGIEQTCTRAPAKLEQMLPAHLHRRLSALHEGTVAISVAGPVLEASVLTMIAAAIRAHQRLRFEYRPHDGR